MPNPPSLRLGLESLSMLGLSLGLWEGGVGAKFDRNLD